MYIQKSCIWPLINILRRSILSFDVVQSNVKGFVLEWLTSLSQWRLIYLNTDLTSTEYHRILVNAPPPLSGSSTVYHQNQAIMISSSRKQPCPLGTRHIPIQNITSFGNCGLYINSLKQAFQSISMFDSINDCQTTLHFLLVMRKCYQTNYGFSNMQSVTLCDYWDVTSQCIICVTQWRRQSKKNWEPFHYALYIFMERRENSF